MKKIIFYLFLLACGHMSFSQSSLVNLTSSLLKKDLDSNDKCLIKIIVKSKSHRSVFVPAKPIFTDSSNPDGHIRFRIERREDSVFNYIDIVTDIFSPDLTKNLKNLSYGDTISYAYDLRNIYVLRPGVYRVKVYLTFLSKNRPRNTESEWVYFNILGSSNNRLR